MNSSRNPPDDLGVAGGLYQAPDGSDSFTSAPATGLLALQPGTLESSYGANDANAVVWIFEALTGRSATAVERLSLLKPRDA